ncbi:YnfU family zinc-binding protein [Enterobacter ludwigii]|uniref:YnfU family zinc-binding protein n=1 Tax=Enterobacter TaxID=547 RepID=UPI002233EA33|nr:MULTISPECIES: YnfU family zinc-binding protein [Enterobacter]
MSFADYAMKFFRGTFLSNVTCPVCGLKSSHPISRIRSKQALLCPGCKALFVAPR